MQENQCTGYALLKKLNSEINICKYDDFYDDDT